MPARMPDALKRVFSETFTARDVAEPLASFDAESPSARVQEFMRARDFDVIGIRRDGQIAGYAEAQSLEGGDCGHFERGFSDVGVLDEGAPLLKVLMTLSHAPFAFIAVLGRVGGIVAHADLQKPPVRMWLFGIVTLIEMRFVELIDQHCPDGAWTKFLSEGRLQKANALLEERGRRNQKLHLIDCLQFSDKGQIIARNEDIRNTTVFTSRSQAEAAVKSLEQLRNNLAHAQDILATDWHTIVQLCEFYHSTVT